MTAFYRTWSGYIRVTGDDCRDWLDRQSTNDLCALAPTRAVRTVLTSPTGRILDVLTVLDEGDALGLVPLPGYAERTLRYLRGRIFFMDKVTVTDAGDEWAVLFCDGDDLSPVAAALGLERWPALDEVVTFRVGETLGRAVGVPGVMGSAGLLLVPVQETSAIKAALEAAGVSPITEEAYEVLRVEAGLPGPGRELTEAYTPLEVGLNDLIAEGKCYPGQEVIARQITYNKVVRRLVKLRLEAAVPEGAEVRVGDKAVGTVTSSVISPREGPTALAVLRRPHDEPGTRVDILAGDTSTTGTVISGLK